MKLTIFFLVCEYFFPLAIQHLVLTEIKTQEKYSKYNTVSGVRGILLLVSGRSISGSD